MLTYRDYFYDSKYVPASNIKSHSRTDIIIVVPVGPFVPVKPWIIQSENVIFGKLYLPVSITNILQNIPNTMSYIIHHCIHFSAAC